MAFWVINLLREVILLERYAKMHFVSKRKKRIMILKIAIFFFVAANLFLIAERRIMPAIVEISMIEAKQISSGVIDRCVKENISGKGFKTADFFAAEGGSFSANTILINDICVSISESVNREMSQMAKRKILIPIGAATGIESFANYGPEVEFYIRQMGKANVDYEAEFLPAGINLVNYRVYISVDLEIKTVNPLGNGVVKTTRKVVLIDTIIEGDMPNNYIKMAN